MEGDHGRTSSPWPSMPPGPGLSALEAELRLLNPVGRAVTRALPIQILQTHTPEGRINRFQRRFERRLPKLLAAYRAERQ